MQTPSASRKKVVPRSVHPESRWTYSPLTGLFFGLLLVGVVAAGIVTLAWDRMPERVQYIPRYLSARFLPERPHPAFVPTPVGVAAPEDALAGMDLGANGSDSSEAAAPLVEARLPEGEAAPAPEAAPDTGSASEADPIEATPAPAVEPAPAAEPPVAPPAAPTYAMPGAAASLAGVRHEFQKWNNCGPATLGMQLSVFGRPDTQAQTAPFLKPDADDKNVSPSEMVAYAQSIGFGGQVVVGGDLELLRTLIANGFPVVVESWFIPEPDDEMGHYLLLTGFDGETLNFHDSYHGPNVREGAAEFDALWKVFNRTAIVVWPPDKAELATAILGERANPEAMYRQAMTAAHAEAEANPQDRFAWFNLGSSLVALGDIPNAVTAFDTARSLELPWRMLWYQFGPYEAYFKSGQYQQVVDLTTTTLNNAGNLEESLYWRGRAQAELGNIAAARSDLGAALKFNPNFAAAQEALNNLP